MGQLATSGREHPTAVRKVMGSIPTFPIFPDSHFSSPQVRDIFLKTEDRNSLAQFVKLFGDLAEFYLIHGTSAQRLTSQDFWTPQVTFSLKFDGLCHRF